MYRFEVFYMEQWVADVESDLLGRTGKDRIRKGWTWCLVEDANPPLFWPKRTYPESEIAHQEVAEIQSAPVDQTQRGRLD